jgi:mannitol/fructose-specific phosphotransferase system IIA component (Ntr-type)
MEPMTTLVGPAVLDPSLYISELKLRRKPSILEELVAHATRAGAVRAPDVLRKTLLLRERLFGTAIGKGVAIPHARSIAVCDPRLLIARSHRGVAWDAPDGQLIHLVLLVLSPAEAGEEAHAEFVSRAAAIGRLQRNRTRLLEAEAFGDVVQVFGEWGT